LEMKLCCRFSDGDVSIVLQVRDRQPMRTRENLGLGAVLRMLRAAVLPSAEEQAAHYLCPNAALALLPH
jgi:hypothetical protein